ncbi:MAG: alpha/beta fold hydrolase [Chloroflexia bacterium]
MRLTCGFGRNPVPPEGMNFSALVRYLGGFLDELGVERAVLVGSSLGGAVVIRYAARYPERVHRLFLLNSAGLLKELAPSFEPTDRETAQELVDIIGGPRLRLPRFILDDLLRETGAPARREYLRSTERTDVSEDLPKIVAPTTIIWGDRDRLIPLDNGERLHAGIEGSELIVLPGVGHGPHVDAARRVVEIIRERLQGDGATAAQSPRLNSGRIASRPYPDGGQ